MQGFSFQITGSVMGFASEFGNLMLTHSITPAMLAQASGLPNEAVTRLLQAVGDPPLSHVLAAIEGMNRLLEQRGMGVLSLGMAHMR